MKLVLAEKPSVAQSIAKVLGAAKREDGYLEGNGYVVSWCVGHLVELAQPEVYDAKYSKWAYADLPIFPMDWQYEVSAGTKKQFGILKKLMAREDVASLVCATDAGREGELIFRLVYHKAGCRKPFERLWISSMEDVAIKEGFENLRSGTEYDALYEAALCRERADWIVGINATRLFSTLYGQTLNVGRVMTPTLAMAVMREAAISAFKPELFYTVQIGLDGFTAASERFKTKAAAEAVKQSCSVAIVQKAECKEKTEKPPALYDLTSLQREANRVLGYTAQQTLDYTQNLYEKKLVTYPRTDSRFLTEDMAHSLTDLVKLAFHTFPVEDVNREAMADLDGKDIMFKFPPTFASTHTALVLKTPKTKTSVRKVFLPKTVAEMLVQRKADIEELKDLFGDEFVDFNLVFCSSNGKPIEGQVINRAFNKLIEEKGLPKVVFHSLRHSSITYKLKLNGGDMKSVQGDSGHAQVKMVADVYSHIIDDDRRLNAERMEAAFYSGRQATPEPVQPAATESSADDKELLLKLLQNPEMAALLKSLAKTL